MSFYEQVLFYKNCYTILAEYQNETVDFLNPSPSKRQAMKIGVKH
jgi:hypothetical protein